MIVPAARSMSAHSSAQISETRKPASRARRHAIKLVDPGDQTRTSRGANQLLREAQALARLIHPNVVAVFEAGVHDGRVYLAMEYVHGVDLQQWLAARRRGWREVAATFLQAGAGLLAAHKVGLVHRDFKPANVLVGVDGRVRVADFGLATPRAGVLGDAPVPEDTDLRGSPSARSRRLAATIAGPGAMIGTPAYMAPELFRCETATAATDQYAFCVALFEALHGRLPFTSDSLEALAYEVLHAELPAAPPDPVVPTWLHALVLRGLARDPARRFPDLAALLAELARDPEGERRRRGARRRQLVAAVALTLVIVVGGVAIYRAVVREAHERRAEARLGLLREQLTTLRDAGRDDEAAQAFASFTALADNRGTAALGRAYREWGEAHPDSDTAIDALAAGYVHARTQNDRIASLRGLTRALAGRPARAPRPRRRRRGRTQARPARHPRIHASGQPPRGRGPGRTPPPARPSRPRRDAQGRAPRPRARARRDLRAPNS